MLECPDSVAENGLPVPVDALMFDRALVEYLDAEDGDRLLECDPCCNLTCELTEECDEPCEVQVQDGE